LSDQKKVVVGPLIVAVLGIAVWWVPDFATFIFFPPLVLGLGVGFVARYTDAPSSVLVITATASTAIIFGVYAARVSSFGVHGDALEVVLVFSALVVAEAALASAAGAALGRTRRNRVRAATRSA
jgi:hypothetical protein